MDINWQSVFEKGAQEFGKNLGSSIGGAIGGPIGSALANAIFGTGNQSVDFSAIEEKLDKINKKIEEISSYIIEKLPKVIYEEALKANIKVEVMKFSSKKVSVFAALDTFVNSKKKNVEILPLQNELNDLLSMGLMLSRQGCPFFYILIESVVVLIVSYYHIMSFDESNKNGLKIWAKEFIKVINLYSKKEFNNNFYWSKIEIDDDINSTKIALSSVDGGSKFYFVCSYFWGIGEKVAMSGSKEAPYTTYHAIASKCEISDGNMIGLYSRYGYGNFNAKIPDEMLDIAAEKILFNFDEKMSPAEIYKWHKISINKNIDIAEALNNNHLRVADEFNKLKISLIDKNNNLKQVVNFLSEIECVELLLKEIAEK